MNRDWPRGFAMITETRTVTLPPGESTIRFTGVAEGMVAVSAIVTGLPGGTIEKNRNADLLSPAALVDGTLGNRVVVTRTNLATGEPVAEEAIVRRWRTGAADGGRVRGRALLGAAREAELRPDPGRAFGAAGVQRRHARPGRRDLYGGADLSRLGVRLASALCGDAR